jgi:hypothetical protein
MVAIQDRANAFLDILGRPIPKAILAIWGAIATWDTFVSQFIPEDVAKSFPKAHQVIAMTYGWLSLQTWLSIGAVIVCLIALEYGARHKWKLEAATGADRPKYDSNRPLLALFWLCVAGVIVAVWSLELAAWHNAQRAAPLPPAPVLPKVTPAPVVSPPPTPPPPPEPWVSDEEVQKAKKSGRLLLPFRPDELARMNYTMGSVGTDAYVGSWVKIDSPFLRVTRFVEKDKKNI